MGVAVGLPFLESMIPAFTPLARAAARPPLRFGVVYFPNGAIMQQFTPSTVGTGFEFTPILKPLEPFKDSLMVVTNLTRSHPGSQVGDHAVSAAGFLTGVWPSETEAEDVLANTTIDQVVAQANRPGHAAAFAGGRNRRFHRLRRRMFPRVQLRLHEHDFVAHSDYASADGNQSPHGVRRIFGEVGDPKERLERIQTQRSMLDSISEEAGKSAARIWARATAPASATISTTSAKSNGASSRPNGGQSYTGCHARGARGRAGLLRGTRRTDV